MDALNLREKAKAALDDLSDEEVAEVLEVMLVLKAEREHVAQYDESNDPVLTGEDLFDGPGDLSIRDEEMLYGDVPRDEVSLQ